PLWLARLPSWPARRSAERLAPPPWLARSLPSPPGAFYAPGRAHRPALPLPAFSAPPAVLLRPASAHLRPPRPVLVVWQRHRLPLSPSRDVQSEPAPAPRNARWGIYQDRFAAGRWTSRPSRSSKTQAPSLPRFVFFPRRFCEPSRQPCAHLLRHRRHVPVSLLVHLS